MAAFDELPPYEFTVLVDEGLPCLDDRDAKEMLLQWNLNETMSISRFRFVGSFDQNAEADYDRLLKDFLRDVSCGAKLGFMGTPEVPTAVELQQLSTAVMSMDFFDRLEEADITRNGIIKGCFEEIYDGISVADKLRDMMANDDSENASLYTEKEKNELIFVLFRLLVLGGSMAQPDTKIERYRELTKLMYKELLTVFKNPASGEVSIAGRCFRIEKIAGLDLWEDPEKKKQNLLVAIVDPLKKVVTTLKVNYKSFW